MSTQPENGTFAERLTSVFERKVKMQDASLRVERAVPRLMPLAMTTMAAGCASLLGVWDYIPYDMRPLALAATAAAAVVPAFFVKAKSPFTVTRNDALRRLDKKNGDLAMPAQMLNEDFKSDDPVEQLFWQTYRQKTREKIEGMKISWPDHRFSPNTTLASMVLATALGVSAIAAGDQAASRLQEAFRFTAPFVPDPPAQILAWITPPDNIAAARQHSLPAGEIISERNITHAAQEHIALTPATPLALSGIHQQSVLHISVIGQKPELRINGQPVLPESEIIGDDNKTTYTYAYMLRDESYTVVFKNGPSWHMEITPDHAPSVTITGAGAGQDGALSLRCIAVDDFGIRGGTLTLGVPGARADAKPPEQATFDALPLAGNDLCLD